MKFLDKKALVSIDFTAELTMPVSHSDLARLAALAYEKKDVVLKTVKHWGAGQCVLLSLTDWDAISPATPAPGQGSMSLSDPQAFLVSFDDVAIFVCRGTQATNIIDWMSDSDAGSDIGPHGLSWHRGFCDAVDLLLSSSARAVVREIVADKKLIVTGHSMGGAMAPIVASQLAPLLVKDIEIICFASPRPMSQLELKDWSLSVHATNYVLEADVVPRVPPRTSHKHICDNITYLSDQQEVTTARKISDAEVDELTLSAALDGTPLVELIKDHAVVGYWRALNELGL